MNEKLVKLIREEFEKAISQKTGWGKNEIMKVFDQALATAALRLLDERKE